MLKNSIIATLFLLLTFNFFSIGIADDAVEIMQNIDRILKPEDTLFRKITLEIRDKNKLNNKWQGCEVRKTLKDGKHTLLLITKPEAMNGIATLFIEPMDNTATTSWIFLPSINRVRRFQNIMAFESYLNTDFTYADLGLIDFNAEHKLISKQDGKNENLLVIETTPQNAYYYSKIITYASKDNFMPVKRDYYAKNGDHWKTLIISDTEFDKNNHLMKAKMKMKDLFDGTSTTYIIDSTEVNAEINDTHLEAKNLKNLAGSEICQ